MNDEEHFISTVVIIPSYDYGNHDWELQYNGNKICRRCGIKILVVKDVKPV